MNLEQIKKECREAVEKASSSDVLENVRSHYFGKTGIITSLLKSLGSATPEERKVQGPLFNALKTELIDALDKKKDSLERDALNAKLQREKIDLTLPGRPEEEGLFHPISQTIEEITHIFGSLGFIVQEGPHIEEDFYNFTALNIPPEHPARQTQDTFYVDDQRNGAPMVLRTHTSPVQIRTMLEKGSPLRVIASGRTFRADYDMTHTPMFHQVEGLVIGENITMGHLKGCLIQFLETFFEVKDLPIRLRPSFFPFTEPSAEVDIGCLRENGTFKIGAGNDWLEVLGCGMVHPTVLKNCSLDPEKVQGFAFGAGIERLAMLKYGIPDLRTFFESDLRWLKHYGFRFFERPSLLNQRQGGSR